MANNACVSVHGIWHVGTWKSNFLHAYSFKEHKNADAQVNFTFVGYVTYYPFYHYPDGIRSRISQFYILPPYQGQGHGGMYLWIVGRVHIHFLSIAHLYNAFVNECLENPDVRDMTGMFV